MQTRVLGECRRAQVGESGTFRSGVGALRARERGLQICRHQVRRERARRADAIHDEVVAIFERFGDYAERAGLSQPLREAVLANLRLDRSAD